MAPIRKNSFTKETFTIKGMTPIEKNIKVVDANGNEYEATYPKRAKGLVKNGRARFIDENTICLACPPNNELEDNNMSENKTVAHTANPEMTVDANQVPVNKFTIEYLLDRLEEIALNQSHLTEALTKLSKMESKGAGDVGTEGQAHAIAAVVAAREKTNQKLLDLYLKMYEDLQLKQK